MDTGKNHNEESLEGVLFERILSDETYKALNELRETFFMELPVGNFMKKGG